MNYTDAAPPLDGLPEREKQLRTHLYEIVNTYEIIVAESLKAVHDPLDRDGSCIPFLRMINIPKVHDDVTYATAMHEIGHIVAKHGHGYSRGLQTNFDSPIEMYDMLTEEHAAWEWAQQNAIEWTPAMEERKQWAIGSYLQQLARALAAHGVVRVAA